MPTVVNLKKSRYTHYIGRPSKLGNPFPINKNRTREEVIREFENYASNNQSVLDEIRKLPEDAILGCFCKPLSCHGDVIISIWKRLHNK